jgi:hypothetical protein
VNVVILNVIAGKSGTKADVDVLRIVMMMKMITVLVRVHARYRVIAGAVTVRVRKDVNIVIITDIVVIGGVTVVVGNHRVVMDVVRTVNRSHQVTVHVVGVVAGVEVEVEVGHHLSQVLSQIKVGVIVTAVVGVITVQSMINRNKVFMNRKVIITST